LVLSTCIVLCFAEIQALLCYMDILVAKSCCILNTVKHLIFTSLKCISTCNLQVSLRSFVSSVLMYWISTITWHKSCNTHLQLGGCSFLCGRISKYLEYTIFTRIQDQIFPFNLVLKYQALFANWAEPLSRGLLPPDPRSLCPLSSNEVLNHWLWRCREWHWFVKVHRIWQALCINPYPANMEYMVSS
jgi:hypothetical protein